MVRKKIVSKFLEESAAKSDLVLAPTLAALVFDSQSEAPELAEKDFERLNLPTMVKPDQVPVWTPESPKVLRGTLVKVCDSPNASIKGKLLWLKLRNGTEITLPCTGVIRNALAPGIKDDSEKLDAALDKFVGLELVFRRTPDKQNSKFKKNMFMFDVLVAKK